MNSENVQYEKTVNIVLFCVDILRKWKLLLIAILAGAVLLGAYKGVIKPDIVGSEAEIAALQAAMDENSAVLDSYKEEISTNEATIASNERQIGTTQSLIAPARRKAVVLQRTLEKSEAALAAARATLSDQNAALRDTVAAAALLPVLIDEAESDRQQLEACNQLLLENERQLETLQNGIETAMARNETLEEYSSELNEQLAQQQEEMEKLHASAGLKPAVKYAVIGAFLGAIAVCGIVFLQHLFGNKLRMADELKEEFGYTVLGSIGVEREKTNKCVELLDKWSGLSAKDSEEQVYAYIAAGIRARSAVPADLVVTGTVDEAVLEQVKDKLSSLLPADYKVTAEANPVYNAKLLADIKKHSILVVEAKLVSDKREISKLRELLGSNKADVVGAIAL